MKNKQREMSRLKQLKLKNNQRCNQYYFHNQFDSEDFLSQIILKMAKQLDSTSIQKAKTEQSSHQHYCEEKSKMPKMP